MLVKIADTVIETSIIRSAAWVKFDPLTQYDRVKDKYPYYQIEAMDRSVYSFSKDVSEQAEKDLLSVIQCNANP